MNRVEIVGLILANCSSSSKHESLRFGHDVSIWHPVILKIHEKTGVIITPKDVGGKTVGALADIILNRITKPAKKPG